MENDKFKESFKYFKSRNPPPDLSLAIDIDGEKHQNVLCRLTVNTSLLSPSLSSILKSEWDVFQFQPCPGLILIRNPFTPLGQRYFMARCLQNYPIKNPTNLQTKNISLEKSSWWEELQEIKDPVAHKKLREDLRWTTLGYHHDWETKVYDEKMRNEFPADLEFLVKEIAKVMKFKEYQPEAAIVNYYPLNATLAGHVDYSEKCNEPLFSISLGQSACFLIGGETKDIKPHPLLLQSGDICIFTEQSRFAYHAVPKIIKIEEKVWNEDKNNETQSNSMNLPEYFDTKTVEIVQNSEQWKAFDDYVSLCRININVRQVFKDVDDQNFVNENKKMKT